MAKATTRLTNDALAFLTERHLAMLTTLRSDNSPHVVAVGFTFDPKTHIARVITTGGSQKAVNADQRGVAVLSQVDGARWLSLEGSSTVSTDPDAVRDAELRYAQRYRTPRVNPRRVVIEVRIERVLGSSELLDRGRRERPSAQRLASTRPAPRRRSCGRSLTDIAPSAVTMTMSSMRAPHCAGEVDARLDAERHALLERQVVARDDVGLLVHRQPDAVPGAVHEHLRRGPRRPARRARRRRPARR